MEIKKENNLEPAALSPPKPPNFWKVPASVIDLSSSSGSDSDSDWENDVVSKRRKVEEMGIVLPVSFLAPLESIPTPVAVADRSGQIRLPGQSCRQFWKAGDYVGSPSNVDFSSGSMDHLRVHPKFLHSNATSHKWALGAFAELLDNSMDETPNGATYVNVDVLDSRKDGSQMLLVEDNGGGMDPEKMRHCMSLGFSTKSKDANTIGQYGNGFKTSTMRLGADVIVFSRCQGKDGKSPTQSIGLLSYTFLRSTGKEDIVVPMLDFERDGREWKRIIRSSDGNWERNMETIVRWSPFNTVADLHSQLNKISDHGTRIIIYNLWEDDQGLLELDFNTDPLDIQLGGVNRDETNIQRAKEYPNSRHFLTYRHSLRSYASILYLRLPPGFRIILRGKDVQHHNIINDMMMSQEITYTPKTAAEGFPKDLNFAAIVTIGFVKDARHHIDVQGFNVYHKNRLIKPFWRLWNAAGSHGRGVIGVLEANFVEPAHDKQGFERTTILARLETRLVHIQKNYWSTNCHQIGYAPRQSNKAVAESSENGNSAYLPQISSLKRIPISSGKGEESVIYARNGYHQDERGGVLGKDTNSLSQFPKSTKLALSSSPVAEDIRGDDLLASVGRTNHWPAGSSPVTRSSGQEVFPTTSLPSNSDDTATQQNGVSRITIFKPAMPLQSKLCDVGHDHLVMESALRNIDKLRKENKELKERLESTDEAVRRESQCEKCEVLETQLQEEQLKFEELNKEQETLTEIFSEERHRRDNEEENLRRKLKDASNTIQELLDQVKLLEKLNIPKLEK